MKYFVHYRNPDPENNPYFGVYDIYIKKYWFSRKKLFKKDLEMEGGLATVINYVLEPHMKSFHTCVCSSDVHPEPREVQL